MVARKFSSGLTVIADKHAFADERSRKLLRERLDKARLRRQIETKETGREAGYKGSKSEVPLESDFHPDHRRNASDGDRSLIDPALGKANASDDCANAAEEVEGLSPRAQQVARNRALWASTLPAPAVTYEQKIVPAKEYKYEYINQGASSKKTPDDFRTKQKTKKKSIDLATPFLR